MNKEVEQKILDQFYQRLVENEPLYFDQQSTVNTNLYLATDIFKQEIERVFKKGPVPLVSISEFKNLGNFVTKSIFDLPLLIIKSEDEQIRVFLNSCRHRGAKIEERKQGTNCKNFVCPFHGWSYCTKGNLTHIPGRREGFPDLEEEAFSLIELPSTTYGGLVWAIPQKEALSWDHFFGFKAEIDQYELNKYELHSKKTTVTPFNWKIGIGLFVETYHIPSTHLKTLQPFYVPNKLVSEIKNDSVRMSLPLRSMLEQFKHLPRKQWKFWPHATTVYYQYPCSLLLMHPDKSANYITMIPIDERTTRVEFNCLIPPGVHSKKARDHFQAETEFFLKTMDEDLEIGKRVQEGIQAGWIEQFHLSTFEKVIDWFHQRIEKQISEG